MVFAKLPALLVSAAAIHTAAAALTRRVTCPDGKNTASNEACCTWYAVRDDIQANVFENGQCNAEAHEALRITFHDAIGYSPTLVSQGKYGGGGADGSIITFSKTEAAFFPNAGLDDIIELSKPFIEKYNVTPGDFVQFAGAVGVSNCPGAPRLEFLTGRPAPTDASPVNLIPGPFDSVDSIIARFADVGLGPAEIVALMASHSVAASSFVDTSVPESPLDSTPYTFDSQVYVEVALKGTSYPGAQGHTGEAMSAVQGELRLLSDHELARDSRTACEWQSFVDNQAKVQSAFRAAMAKMSVIGQDRNSLIDCSEVIPTPQAFNEPAHFPAGLSISDVEASCDSTPFPSLKTDPGAATSVAPVVKATST